MTARSSSMNFSLRKASWMSTTCSFLLALVSIQLGRRLSIAEHMSMFNWMAAVILALVVAGFVAALMSLVKSRAKSGSSWLAAGLALLLLLSYLFDD
ncbi:MAG TPA: hypothetical protein VFD07_13360 [Candidatus Krumholzibacteria bacterium]|nr:hypothetical protein [Candidatus Krumholzibacteria bacterium]